MLSKVTRYISILLLGIFVLGFPVTCALAPAGEYIAPTLANPNITLDETFLATRAPGVIQEWFQQRRFPGVWTGVIKHDAFSAEDFATARAKEAYESIMEEGGKTGNLVACLCIYRQTCYVASKPTRDTKPFILPMISLVPQWDAALGAKNSPDRDFHAEDLALAIASQRGARFPYSVSLNVPPSPGGTQPGPMKVKAFMAVYGLYKDHEDWAGKAGVRWPCKIPRNPLTRDTACEGVLDALEIEHRKF